MDKYLWDAANLISKLRSEVFVCFSGGKDSTALLGLFLLAKQINPHLKFSVVHSNTLMEMPFLDDHVLRCKKQCDALDVSFNILVAPQKDRFHYNVLGRGLAIPNRNFRWCTDKLKIRPITKFLPKDAVMVNGERLGESIQRDKKLTNLGCASGSNECGVDKHTEITDNIIRPLLNWSVCQVWDAIAYCDLNGILPDTYDELSVIYSINKTETGSMRTGCVGCPLVKKDNSLNVFAAANPKWQPLTEIKAIYTRLTLAENRIMRQDKKGNIAPGCIKLSARKQAFDDILEIESRIPRYNLITPQDKASITQLLADHTYPRGYTTKDPQIITDIQQFQSLIIPYQ
jgi:DNA sulfur modification protein DndC